MTLLFATLTAVVAIGAPGHHQGGQQYEVIWTVAQCPKGFLCKQQGEQVEPNYGQALKLERQLVQEGYVVTIVPVQA